MHHAGASSAMDAAWNNGWEVITSWLVVMEALGVVRRRVTEDHRYKSGSDEEREEVDRAVREATSAFLKHMRTMRRQKRLRIVELDGWFPAPSRILSKMLEHAGFTVPGRAGQICRYRGIGLLDWLHIIFARAAGATVICTTDKAFADIAGNDGEFGHIQIQLTSVGAIGPLYGPAGPDGGA